MNDSAIIFTSALAAPCRSTRVLCDARNTRGAPRIIRIIDRPGYDPCPLLRQLISRDTVAARGYGIVELLGPVHVSENQATGEGTTELCRGP